MLQSSNLTGIETGKFFNATVMIKNSFNVSRLINITMNITNSTGSNVNSSTHLGMYIGANATILHNFTDINTSTWLEDDYTISLNVTGNMTRAIRSEQFIYRNIMISNLIILK